MIAANSNAGLLRSTIGSARVQAKINSAASHKYLSPWMTRGSLDFLLLEHVLARARFDCSPMSQPWLTKRRIQSRSRAVHGGRCPRAFPPLLSRQPSKESGQNRMLRTRLGQRTATAVTCVCQRSDSPGPRMCASSTVLYPQRDLITARFPLAAVRVTRSEWRIQPQPSTRP